MMAEMRDRSVSVTAVYCVHSSNTHSSDLFQQNQKADQAELQTHANFQEKRFCQEVWNKFCVPYFMYCNWSRKKCTTKANGYSRLSGLKHHTRKYTVKLNKCSLSPIIMIRDENFAIILNLIREKTSKILNGIDDIEMCFVNCRLQYRNELVVAKVQIDDTGAAGVRTHDPGAAGVRTHDTGAVGVRTHDTVAAWVRTHRQCPWRRALPHADEKCILINSKLAENKVCLVPRVNCVTPDKIAAIYTEQENDAKDCSLENTKKLQRSSGCTRISGKNKNSLNQESIHSNPDKSEGSSSEWQQCRLRPGVRGDKEGRPVSGRLALALLAVISTLTAAATKGKQHKYASWAKQN